MVRDFNQEPIYILYCSVEYDFKMLEDKKIDNWDIELEDHILFVDFVFYDQNGSIIYTKMEEFDEKHGGKLIDEIDSYFIPLDTYKLEILLH